MIYKGIKLEKWDNLVIKIISFFWCVAKFWSFGSWSLTREFPRISVFHNLEISIVIIMIIQIVIIILLIYNLITIKKWILSFIVFFEVVLCICDYIFLQPWNYIYLVVFVCYILFSNNKEKFYKLFLFLLSSVYILSGIHKLNRKFLEIVWNKMFLNNFLGLLQDTVLQYKLFFLGLSIPIFEIAFGLGLWFNKTKNFSSISLIFMHIFILIFIGPFGLNYNSIVWIWNVNMICLFLLLMFKKTIILSNTLDLKFIFLGIPLSTFLFDWNSYITFNLYASKNQQIKIYFSSKNNLPNTWKRLGNKDYIYAQDWALDAMKIPPSPEKWYMNRLEETLKKDFKNNNSIKSIIRIE